MRCESTRALKAGLATLKSLYHWRSSPDAALPLRWDAGLPIDVGDSSEQFLVGPSGTYTTGIATNDIHHFPARSRETLVSLLGLNGTAHYEHAQRDYWERYRRWELSMDEVTGLVTTYWIIHKLARDSEIHTSVQRQARWLGNYLADHGYLLVRPMGGLSWRGASGLLPGLEFPFARALGHVAGLNLSSRSDFRRCMELAGHWRNLPDQSLLTKRPV